MARGLEQFTLARMGEGVGQHVSLPELLNRRVRVFSEVFSEPSATTIDPDFARQITQQIQDQVRRDVLRLRGRESMRIPLNRVITCVYRRV